MPFSNDRVRSDARSCANSSKFAACKSTMTNSRLLEALT
jgi:hypothetical protein